MSSLTDYVDHINFFRKAAKQPLLSLAIAKDRQAIADRIDGDLSPENLTCDGELSRTAVQRRYSALVTAAKQLKKVDPAVTFYEYTEEIF
jgi:hypothetical protein